MRLLQADDGHDVFRERIRHLQSDLSVHAGDYQNADRHVSEGRRYYRQYAGRQEQYSIGFFGMLNNYMLYWFGRDAESRPELSEGQAHELVHQFLYGIYV